MKMHAGTAAIWLLLQLSLTGCGLGTEVGNGVKPESEDDSKKTSASQKADPAEQQDAVNSQSDNEDAGTVPEGAEVSSDVPGTYDFDINILLNSCGSPFESGYNGKFNLNGKNIQGKIYSVSGEYNFQTGTWVLKDTFGKILATISDDDTTGDGIVEVYDADQVPFDSGYVCNQQTGSTENSTKVFNYELIKNGKSTTLSWSVGENGSDEKLISISIKPESAESKLIELKAIKQIE